MHNEDDLSYLDKAEIERKLIASARSRHNTLNGSARSQHTWHGTAFVLEAVALVFFLTVSLAVVTNLFGSAHKLGQTSNDLTCAITLATTGSENGAEAFAANPEKAFQGSLYYTYEGSTFHKVETYTSGLFAVTNTITSTPSEGGVMYTDTIVVTRFNENVYKLETKKFVSSKEVR